MRACIDCGDPAQYSQGPFAGLCGLCSLLSPNRPAPSARTVEEYFEDGVAEGKAAYLIEGPQIMSRLDTFKALPVRDGGPVLEPQDLDALTRGFKAGVIRSNRLAHGLPELCDNPRCGRFMICNSCKSQRK